MILADTKFEFGLVDGAITLADEVLTPDSSRYWPADQYAPGGPTPSFDKQYVRDYLESIRWNKQAPAPALPDEVVANTRAKYMQALSAIGPGAPLSKAMPTALNQAVNWNALQANVLRFNAFDWLLVIVVLLSALAAFRRGIIRVLFSLAGLTCGIVFASWNYLRLAGSLHRWVTSFAIAQVVAFVLLVVVVTVLFSVVASLISTRGVGGGPRPGRPSARRVLRSRARRAVRGVALMMAAIAFLPSASLAARIKARTLFP